MVYRSRSADWGGFSKGFAEAFAAMMKLSEDKRHNEALETHWAHLEDIERMKLGANPVYGANAASRAAHDSFKEGYGSAPSKGEDTEMRDHIIKWSQDHGKNPEEALAIWRQESSGGTNMVGDGGSSFGDFQFHFGGMNTSMPHAGMGDDFKQATGIDLRTDHSKESRYKAVDFALDRASKKGWGDWANSVKATGVPISWSGGKPATTTAEPTVDGKPAVTTIVSPEEPAKGEKPKAEPAKTSQADTLPTNQLAGGTDEEAMRIAVEENRKLINQQNDDSPAPPPGAAMPRNERSLPPLPRPSAGPISAIEPTVPAQDTSFNVPPESGFPLEYPVHGARPDAPMGGVRGLPAPAGARPDAPGMGGRGLPPAPVITPAVTSTEGRPDIHLTGPFRPPGYGPPSPITPAVTSTEGRPDVPYISPGRTGPAEVNVPLASGERDERTTPDSAKPAPNAQPVSATKPTPQSRQDNSRFVLVDRPNADPIRRGYEGAPQSTALNLSSLWGPNPPISQRGQAAAAASTPAAAAPSRHDDWNDVPPAPDNTNTAGITDEMIMGSRKGGPIRGYARGGAIPTQPTMRYAGGGAAGPGSFGYVAPSMTNTPQFTAADITGRQNVVNQMHKAVNFSPTTTFGDIANTYAGLTPAQQKWYMDASSAINTANQYPGMGSLIYKQLGDYPATPAPAAATPAPAAATPAPKVVNPTVNTTVTPVADTTTTDPSTTAGTGIPNVPTNPAIAKSYDPNVDAVTGKGFANTQNAGGTNYSVGAGDTLKADDTTSMITGYAQRRRYPHTSDDALRRWRDDWSAIHDATSFLLRWSNSQRRLERHALRQSCA